MNRFLYRASLYVLALLVLLGSAASAATPFAAPAPVAAAASTSTALRVPLALLLVIALVLGAAWLLRRLTGLQAGSTQRLQIVAQLSLGTRERVVLVRVGTQELLLGIAAGSVRNLQTFAAPVEAAGASLSVDNAGTAVSGVTSSTKPDFANTLRDVLRRSIGK